KRQTYLSEPIQPFACETISLAGSHCAPRLGGGTRLQQSGSIRPGHGWPAISDQMDGWGRGAGSISQPSFEAMLLDAEVFIHRHPFSPVWHKTLSGGERMLFGPQGWSWPRPAAREDASGRPFFLSPIPKNHRNR